MTDIQSFHCQVLPVTAIDQAAKVTADAFLNSPTYVYIFRGDKEYRRGALEWLFQRNMILVQNLCPSAFRGMLNREGEVVACFLWTPSRYTNLSTWDLLKAGLWQMPFLFGPSTVARLLKVIDCFDEYEKKFLSEHDEYIMLERMVVRPDYQGQGLGTRCLKTVIAETSKRIQLATQETRNVSFYKRLGLTIAGEVDMFQNEKDYAFHCWFMSSGR